MPRFTRLMETDRTPLLTIRVWIEVSSMAQPPARTPFVEHAVKAAEESKW